MVCRRVKNSAFYFTVEGLPHLKINSNIEKVMQQEQKRLVIVGGGFAGVKLASNLEKTLPKDWDIYLLSKTNFITYNPLLPEVIGASILPGHVQAPFRLILKRTRIRMVTVDIIDYEAKEVYYHNDRKAKLSYDQLVVAAGVRANTEMLPGLHEHTLPLKTVGDALYIRNQVIERLEQATIHPDPERREELASFVILGGGFSGVETVGELEDFIRSAQRYYKNVTREGCRITIVHSGDRLLPELSEKLSANTLKNFKKRNIDIILNERAERIEHEKVILKSGKEIRGATIICTIGTAPHAFIQNASLPSERGKILTQADMSIDGFEGVWSMGDCALVPNEKSGQMSPPTAQFADRQANFLAKNIVAKLSGKETIAFSYKPMGMLASIGHNKAVAEILFLEWNWAMFFPPDIAHLGYKRSKDD